MTRAASDSRLGSNFDRFLFEPIGQDQNGMPLNVVSVLARMDLDAWQEAGTLAALPKEEAAQKLMALFRASPDQALLESDQAATVARLIALLPRPLPADTESRPLAVVTGAAPFTRAGMRAIFLAGCVIALLVSQFVLARRELPTLGAPMAESTSRPLATRNSPDSAAD